MRKPHSSASLTLVFATLLLAAACTQSTPTYSVMGGGQVDFASLHGKVVLVNYWATWCKPCRTEIPELNAFAKLHEGRVRVLSVNFDGVQGPALVEQVAELGIEFDTLLLDPRKLWAAPDALGLPETLVIGRDGQLHKVLLGPQTLEGLNAILLTLEESAAVAERLD